MRGQTIGNYKEIRVRGRRARHDRHLLARRAVRQQRARRQRVEERAADLTSLHRDQRQDLDGEAVPEKGLRLEEVDDAHVGL